MSVDDLVGWLRVQLDEDERVARAATPGPWHVDSEIYPEAIYAPDCSTVLAGGRWGGEASIFETAEDAVHIARHDPSRVLREVEAKRQMLGRHFHLVDNMARRLGLPDMCGRCGETWPCADLRDLASIYVDRPGYREDWRPTSHQRGVHDVGATYADGIRVQFRQNAGEVETPKGRFPERYAQHAFDSCVGKEVPLKLEDQQVGMATLIAAKVIEDGRAVLLTYEIPPRLPTAISPTTWRRSAPTVRT